MVSLPSSFIVSPFMCGTLHERLVGFYLFFHVLIEGSVALIKKEVTVPERLHTVKVSRRQQLWTVHVDHYG